jgi:hypothetical protein
MEERSIIRRKRTKHELSFEERLLATAEGARSEADNLPPGEKREMLLKLARESEAAVEMNRWISSPGLRTPK